MEETKVDPQLIGELSTAHREGLASGKLMTPSQIDQHLAEFRANFGPAILGEVDGEALLRLMHGKESSDQKCLAYWLEFKNDDQFAGRRFGSISGGSALKFGIFQRQKDHAWIIGSSNAQSVISVDEAVAFARDQRKELLAGLDVLSSMDLRDISDAAYSRLQAAMQSAAPKLSGDAWAHKYWFLLNTDRLDDYHSPRYQRFHLLKLLQMPPDDIGILDGGAPRFNCAGRYIAAARQLGAPVTTLNKLLNLRDGSMHRYWKVGTTDNAAGGSFWSSMRNGGFAAINWEIPDLTTTILLDKEKAKNQIREWLLPQMSSTNEASNKSVASRKAGEILNFAVEMQELDLVIACQGQTVLGIGRVRGPYEFDAGPAKLHKRPVDWLTLEPRVLPVNEGPYTSVYQLGKSAKNLLEIERRLFYRDPAQATIPAAVPDGAPLPLQPLNKIAARLETILRRKGQVILYGPPGTGKTYTAFSAANELAARHAFGKGFDDLSIAESAAITSDGGLVRVCTFHPGWGYEDFIEGLRPAIHADQMVFSVREGVFKTLCADAAKQPDRDFFLVIDEINRGDLPRIFGELITTIEYDKRGRLIRLPVSGSTFAVPKNVFLIGTMNTADRSISLIDLAFRRRFGFLEIMPDSTLLTGKSVGGLQLGPWLDALNARLRKNLKRDARNLQIGHAYLMPPLPINSVAEFARVLRDDIIPLLEEYCYDDFATLKEILGDDLVDADAGRIREEIFEANREAELIGAVSFAEINDLLLSAPQTGNALGAELTDAVDGEVASQDYSESVPS